MSATWIPNATIILQRYQEKLQELILNKITPAINSQLNEAYQFPVVVRVTIEGSFSSSDIESKLNTVYRESGYNVKVKTDRSSIYPVDKDKWVLSITLTYNGSTAPLENIGTN